MEMQLFLLGHVILLGMCFCTAIVAITQANQENIEKVSPFTFLLATAIYFIPLEIIYWVLHWIFV